MAHWCQGRTQGGGVDCNLIVLCKPSRGLTFLLVVRDVGRHHVRDLLHERAGKRAQHGWLNVWRVAQTPAPSSYRYLCTYYVRPHFLLAIAHPPTALRLPEWSRRSPSSIRPWRV